MDAFAHQHYTRSTSTFMRRAKLGQAIAQTYLGYMCANGLGAPQNFFHEVTTVKWLRRAADQGYPAAQFLLGLTYDKGHGVRQDFIEAEVWPDLAASRVGMDADPGAIAQIALRRFTLTSQSGQ
jgi:hypothetical protein